jgi:Ser/Thr protein kinase RdoA (MazF antagonist)
LTPDNLLHSATGLQIIDFDDCGFGWYMFELATALFCHLGKPHFETVERSLLAGYRTVLPLSDERWRQLPLFLFVRSLTYLGWMCSRPETETAREQTEPMIELAVQLAQAYQARS